jgi:hypothetical protein
VTPFRTGKCSNLDDHIDGNHLNNVPKNGAELCPLCHKYKGMLSGDFKNQNRYFYKNN